MKNVFKKSLAVIAVFFTAYATHAAEYQINVSGDFNKDSGPSVFGITNAVTPIEMSITVDTALGGITALPMGSAINPGESTEYTFSSALTFIPRSAIKTLGVSLGTSNWLASNLFDQIIFSRVYGILISGNLANGTVASVSFVLANGVGEMASGFLDCVGTVCNITNSGYAYSYNDNAGGTLTDVSATVTEIVTQTTDVKLQNLTTSVSAANASAATKIVLTSHIRLAQKSLKNGNQVALKNSLETFIQMTEVFSGKSLSSTDAAALRAQAQATLDSLT